MKSASIMSNGDLECLEIVELPIPEPADGEVLVEVKAAALNHLDIWIRKGRPGVNPQFPHTLGSDAAGIVKAVGNRVQHVKVGDEVVVNPGLSCGKCETCLRGEHSECPDFSLLGVSRPGTFAEYVTVPEENVQLRPSYLTWEESAAYPLAYLTAWRMLITRAGLRPGETVLIHGIGGGVALAALQLATLTGAWNIVTSSSPEKLEEAEALGANAGINYKETENVAQKVLELTKGRGVDIVIDTVGAATWPINVEATRKGGRIVHCGVTGGPNVQANISPIYWRQLNILGSTMGSHEDFRQLTQAMKATVLRPVIDSVFPLEQARDAQAKMESGAQFGKIVLSM